MKRAIASLSNEARFRSSPFDAPSPSDSFLLTTGTQPRRSRTDLSTGIFQSVDFATKTTGRCTDLGDENGAARILLLSKQSLPVVPIGLWFTKKEEFRSEVLVRIGPPVAPPEERSVEAWTEAIERALLDVTLNADDWEDHELVAAVNALYGERIRKDFLEGEERKGGELSGSFQVPPGGIAHLRAMRDALVAECDRLAGVFRRASDNPAR